ncbi:MAG: hypothetical protein ACLFP1_03195 [Candidatus Goldiibacteriota bacterium]
MKKDKNINAGLNAKLPVWAVITGVIAVVTGAAGIMNGFHMIMLPKVLSVIEKAAPDMEELKKKMAEEMKKEGLEEEIYDERIAAFFSDTMRFPAGAKRWFMGSGAAGVLISVFYLYGAVLLLQAKKQGPRIFGAALIAGIVFGIFKVFLGLAFFSLAGLMVVAAACIGAAVNIVLFIIVLTADKSAYKPQTGSKTA